jgi:AcrR family transcriptional regulator
VIKIETRKSDDQKARILERLADHVLAHGLSASSLRPLARAAQTSDRMLLYYFKDKSEMMAAVLDKLSQRLIEIMATRAAAKPLPLVELQPLLINIMLADELWPYMRLWLEMASLAGHGDAFYRTTGEQIGRGFLAWGMAQLDSPTEKRRIADAAKLLVMTEGMVLLKSLGLDDIGRDALQ